MKKLITLFAIAGMVLALAPAAQAAIILDGVTKSDPLTTSGVYTANGVNTMDDGSLWTHNDNLLKFGNRTTASITISGGAVLNVTATEAQVTDGDFCLQFGNQGGGVVQALVTGTGSKATTVGDIQVGRNESNCTLTIEDGGLVVAEMVVLSRDSGSNNLLRMGAGGILAIEGTGKTTTGQFWTTNGSGEMQYNPSGDGTTWVNITAATAGTDYTIADGTGDLAGYTVLEMMVPSTPGVLIVIR